MYITLFVSFVFLPRKSGVHYPDSFKDLARRTSTSDCSNMRRFTLGIQQCLIIFEDTLKVRCLATSHHM
jgi:hypothetical protein